MRRDIFALPIEWQDDTREAVYMDLDGNEVTFTVDRVIWLASNTMSGHHSLCEMDDCKEVETQNSQMMRMMGSDRKPEMVRECWVYGPTSPARVAKNKQLYDEIDEKIRKELPGLVPYMDAAEDVYKRRRKMGFDIDRDAT